MKQTIIIGIILMIGAIIAGCTTLPTTTPSTTNKAANTQTPTPAENTFHSSTGLVGFKIQHILAENNVDPLTNAGVSDHIEIILQNVIDKDITNVTVQYVIVDRKTGKNESTRTRLTGFILKAHATEAIHFDNKKELNHFSTNKYGLYYTSQNELEITITVSADGYQAQTDKVVKGAGGAELVD